MKKHLQLSAIILATGAFLFAQEKTEISMKIVKDGKVVKDTTYTFDDAKEAKHAVHMFEVMASGELDISEDGGDCEHGKKKVIKKEIIIYSGEDGEKGEWTVKDCDDGDEIEVIIIKKKIGEGDDEEYEVEIKQHIQKEK